MAVNSEEQRIFIAQTERLREIESWLAMLIVRHGEFTGSTWQYIMSDASAQIMRSALPTTYLIVSCEFDLETEQHTLTAM